MGSEGKKISKVSRILSVYHLFYFCKEVSFKEITDLMPVGRKTIERDIAMLKAAGLLNIRFSKRLHAFVPAEGGRMVCRMPPVFPESKVQRDSMEKIIRLVRMMTEIGGSDDPAVWFREQYPMLSTRTMQRDFAELNAIGYNIIYNDWDDTNEVHPIGRHSCDYPYDTYSLLTFTKATVTASCGSADEGRNYQC